MSPKIPRNSYGKKYKIAAIKLVLESDRSVKSIATDLGNSEDTLINRKRKYLVDSEDAFPGKR